MLGMPEPTAYDLRFRLLDVPVRVHPAFWLSTAFLAGQDADLREVLIWIGCVFASILVHEYGHALVSRVFRCSPSIVLYMMGGLCYSEDHRQTPWQRLAVLFGGPGAGLLLFALIWGGHQALGSPRLTPLGHDIFVRMVYINLYWSLINLLPIWPLDGGQIAGVLLAMFNRHRGMHWTHVVSLVTAGVLAIWSFQQQDMFRGIFFALFGVINFQVLQTQHHAARYGALEDDADWWKR
jgi:stage IV sporulation protein FB